MLLDPGKRMIGLMMIRNEADMLEETLDHLVSFYDRIYVLDGTSPSSEFERSKSILSRYPEIQFALRDEDTFGPFPIRDGARHYLLQAIRKDWGIGHWIGILHGDEIYTRDPRVFLRTIDPRRTPVVQVKLCHCYLHTSDRPNWATLANLPVEERVTHCMWPGTPEDRFFFDDGTFDYEPHRHSLVVPVPHGQGRELLHHVVIKQFNYRSPQQMQARAEQRIRSCWQTNHYQHIVSEQKYFVESLHVPGYQPCGYDNVRQSNPENWSKPRSLRSAPVISLSSAVSPIFVGGIPRSGTTICKSVLGSHSQLASLQWESKLISYANGLMDLLYAYSDEKLARFMTNMRNSNPTTDPEFECREVDNWLFRAMNGQNHEIAELADELDYLQEHLRDTSLPLPIRQKLVAQFIHFLFDRVALKKGASMWVEQTPMNMHWACEILKTFPTAHFVHLTRDPRDVVASLLQRWWAPNPMTECVEYYKKRFYLWQQTRQRILQQKLDERLIEIRFEDLISDPMQTLTKVFLKLGVKPLRIDMDSSKANVGRWRRQFAPSQQASLCEQLRTEIECLGYESG